MSDTGFETRETENLSILDARHSSGAVFRGGESQTASARERKLSRVLALKIELDWKEEASKELYRRIRDLSWQAAFYRNAQSLGKLAECRGWRLADDSDPHGITKSYRQSYKNELSGAAYSAAEREVAAAFSRDAAKIFAGQPPPMWKPTASLSIRGHARRADSGVRLEIENNQFVAYIAAQSKHVGGKTGVLREGGCWLRLPIAKNTRRDEHQGELLSAMVAWAVPIDKATIQVKPHGLILRLAYKAKQALPPMGERIATLGPVSAEGRLLLRTETQTKDYTWKLTELRKKKDEWDLIRRRVLLQIGWRKGQARLKRIRLSRVSWDEWLQTHLHTWSREMADWCCSQGVGTIRVVGLSNGDWPADRLTSLLTYKAEDLGIQVTEGADVAEASGERAAKAEVARRQRRTKKRREAERELQYQLSHV